jgi:hypothetical protein
VPTGSQSAAFKMVGTLALCLPYEAHSNFKQHRSHAPAFSRLHSPELYIDVTLKNQRAQGRPDAGCTRGLVCNKESTRVRNHRFNRSDRPSLRNGVNGVVRALPGVRDLIVTVASQVSCKT